MHSFILMYTDTRPSVTAAQLLSGSGFKSDMVSSSGGGFGLHSCVSCKEVFIPMTAKQTVGASNDRSNGKPLNKNKERFKEKMLACGGHCCLFPNIRRGQKGSTKTSGKPKGVKSIHTSGSVSGWEQKERKYRNAHFLKDKLSFVPD